MGVGFFTGLGIASAWTLPFLAVLFGGCAVFEAAASLVRPLRRWVNALPGFDDDAEA